MTGQRTGQGIHEWSNGSRYEGGVRAGLPDGFGEYTRPDGWTYRGEYAAGARHGHGDLTWPNGNRYVGAFASDQRNGFGYLHWRDGTRQLCRRQPARRWRQGDAGRGALLRVLDAKQPRLFATH